MSGVLLIHNRQRARKVDRRMLRRIIRTLLQELLELEEFELRVFLTSSASIARLNQKSLQHDGPTDVITFDYSDELRPGVLAGDIYICPEVATEQARRFRTTWQSELVRYVVHGVLHLQGFDDRETAKRRCMKKTENKLLKQLAQRFAFSKLGGHPRLEREGGAA